MYSKILITLMAVVMTLPMNAQKRKSTIRKKVTPVVVEEPSKFDEMLDNTQQIIFIDSLVVNKKDFLENYLLTRETGTITNYNKFFDSTEQPYSTVYVNELGNKCWFAKSGRIYTSDKLGAQWGEPVMLEGLGDYQRLNYPFMLADGTTLYFAAISNEGLGGLDIYASRYDSETGKYLLAENIGLPFNSDANDYMYVVDEVDTLGWFVTDRRQPEGRVCVYTFVPPLSRENLSIEAEGLSTVRSRAALTSIADTWDGHYVELALAERRLKQMKEREYKPVKVNTFSFIINDDITYTSEDDFKVVENKTRLDQLKEMQQMLAKSEKELEDARVKYHNANRFDRSALGAEILKAEKELQQLRLDIASMNRRIRNDEIRAINN